MVTLDTNIAIYAFTDDPKADRADEVIATAEFLSAQVLNEFAYAMKRKSGLAWPEITRKIMLLSQWVPSVRPIEFEATGKAVRLAERYELNYFDALMIAVALSNGATTLYSEDMHHGLVIDGTLTIINPFRPTDPQ